MMTLDILTPSGTLADSVSVSAVFLPGTAGEFEVLDHHAPIISSLETGRIRYRAADGEKEVKISSGFVTVSDNHIRACVEQ